MLKGVSGFMGSNSHRSDRSSLKVLGGEKKRFLERIIVISQMASDLLDANIGQTGLIKNLA